MQKILIVVAVILAVSAAQLIDLNSCSFDAKCCTAQCVGKPCGYKLPDPDNCLGYFQCLCDSTYTMHNCPYGEVFDVTTRTCVVGKCPQCSASSPGTPTPGTPTPGTPTPGTPTPGTPTPGTPTPGTPTPGTPTPGTPTPGTPTPGTPTPGTPSTPSATPGPACRPDCSNKEDGLIIGDLCNCRFFWQCLNRVPILRFCEKGMHWDRERFVCDFPYNVQNCNKT